MSFETVRAYFERFGMADRCMDLKESSATVAQAALALGTEEARIAKTLSFLVEEVIGPAGFVRFVFRPRQMFILIYH